MLNEIIKGKRRITPRIALKLEAALGISAGYWLKGQQMYYFVPCQTEKPGNLYQYP